MALVVPNAGETTGGNRFEALDQAEPDALDFEVLSLGGSGVVSGCIVSSLNSSSNVVVSSGVVVLNGVPYNVPGAPSLPLPSAPADNRFDLVVARVTSGVAAFTVLQGVNSSTNPAFPRSVSVLNGSPVSNNFDPDRDVLIASLYRSGANTVTTSRIVDKRVMRTSSIVLQGTAPPLTSQGAGPGSLFYRASGASGPSSGVWVKAVDGSWIELAQNVGSHLPIGAAAAWPTAAPVPEGCVEANGQSLAVSAYPALFSIYGYEHGGSGSSFNVPNFNNRYLRGTTNTSLVQGTNPGSTFGADSVTLSESQMPSHSHSLASHTHSYAHTHGINHTHAASNTGQHSSQNLPVLNNKGGPWYLYSFTTLFQQGVQGAPGKLGYDDGPNGFDGKWTVTVPAHSHTIPALSYTGSTVSQSTSTTLGPSVASTGSTGAANPVSILPASRFTRWIIRASLGVDTSNLGAPLSPYRSFSMSVSTDEATDGSSFLWVAAFDCAIRKVRAYRSGGTSADVNVTINGTPVLDTDIETSDGVWLSEDAGFYVVNEDDVIAVTFDNVVGAPDIVNAQVDLVS
jgi:microcystin-dependent protein